MNIFLDDERHPRDVTWIKIPNVTWQIIRTYKDFVSYITKNGPPENVSFDHDLGILPPIFDIHKTYKRLYNEELKDQTGYCAAKWLCNYCQDKNIKFPNYTVHSMNPIGADNIKNYIENWRKHCEI